jgi:CRISPR-associated endonuclease Csn1
MSKKILSLDLGTTSIGFSILNQLEEDRYSLVDYGVSMFDKAVDKDGNSKQFHRSASLSTKKLYSLRKERKKQLAILFEQFGFGDKEYFLYQEKQNIYKDKWYLRAEKAFDEKLKIEELFTILYTLAKHRGYKSLDSGDLLEELCEKLSLSLDLKKGKKNKKDKKADEEKGKIKKALLTIEELKQNSDKTVAQIIYEIENNKNNPTYRNHDNYRYMIRREYIDEEIEKLINSQMAFGLFGVKFDSINFIQKLKDIITYQNPSTNDMDLFSPCEYYPESKVAHQYSIISDIFKMYQSVSDITFNKKETKITKEQIQIVADDFFNKIKKNKDIPEIKYKDIRKLLKLDDTIKIFNKDDDRNSIIKFHFVNTLSKIDNSFIVKALDANDYTSLKDIFEILQFNKDPNIIYNQLKTKLDDKTIINLIKNKNGNSLHISQYAMIKFLPYLKDGLTINEIKQKLKLSNEEDYSKFKKGIKYLSVKQFETDDELNINNHPVKYAVSATMRLVKHLHITYGVFDEIRVESTRELSQNEETKKAIKKANIAFEKEVQNIVSDDEYQKIAQDHGKNLLKYARKILLWISQDYTDIYTGETISVEDIFTNSVDLDHIVPQSLGGLSVKHNFVLASRDTNMLKSNQLPMNFVKNKQEYINRVENLFAKHKINWKKKINLLATTLDETFKDTFESKSLRATSYIEALTAKIFKRYYPFTNQEHKNSISVRHIQGRATSNIRKLLKVKTKVRDTNIHHAIDAILIGLINASWLQKLSNTFRDNMGIIDDKARENIKKDTPLIDGIEPKELVAMIEDNYNIYGEESLFYKDIWGKVKAVNFWVSKKPMVSKIHKDTIYSIKQNDIFTAREGIINKFKKLEIKVTTSKENFEKSFKKNILNKMYLYETNPNDKICKIVQKRAEDIKVLLNSFITIDMKNKELLSEAKIQLENLIDSDIIDNNENIVRKVKFYQTNLNGYNIRGGLATKEKTFIGFCANIEDDKLIYKRIDVTNFDEIKEQNNNAFKVFKNNLVFFIYPDKSYKGGKIVSFLEDTKKGAFSNSRFPSNIEHQPKFFITIFKGKANSHKQLSLNKAIGIIKLNLDIVGNIKSYQKIGSCESELLEFIQNVIKS